MTRLKLPKALSQVLAGCELPVAVLREGTDSRRSWLVALLLDGEGNLWLTHGWNAFVVEHGLAPGYFLKFRLKLDAHGARFSVIFNGSMCVTLCSSDDEADNDKNSMRDSD